MIPEMVEIPKGDIGLRDDRINRKWTVHIQSFLIGRYPVTQKQYLDISGTTPSHFRGDNHPVECISWMEAITFCNLASESEGFPPYYHYDFDIEKLTVNSESKGYRLPSEAEWEYACKAGHPGIRYGAIDAIAWYRENSNGMTHDVGQKEPNIWGLYDMLGNVWEWCSDIYDETVYGTYRILRGGGWNDEERGCIATNRRRSHPHSFKIDDLGFRIARNLPQS